MIVSVLTASAFMAAVLNLSLGTQRGSVRSVTWW